MSAFRRRSYRRILLLFVSCLLGLIYSCGGNNEPPPTPVDNSAPTVVSLNPVDSAMNVPVDAHISITFNKPGVPITFSVKGGGTNIDCAISASGTTYTIVPMSGLSAGTTYTVSVISSDSSGGQHTSTWSFTTSGPPTVIDVSGGGSWGCNDGSIVTITFSELMDSSTINSSTINAQVYGTNIQVPGTIAGSGSTYTFTSSASFLEDLEMTITTGVRNLSGDSMVANYAKELRMCGL